MFFSSRSILLWLQGFLNGLQFNVRFSYVYSNNASVNFTNTCNIDLGFSSNMLFILDFGHNSVILFDFHIFNTLSYQVSSYFMHIYYQHHQTYIYTSSINMLDT